MAQPKTTEGLTDRWPPEALKRSDLSSAATSRAKRPLDPQVTAYFSTSDSPLLSTVTVEPGSRESEIIARAMSVSSLC